MAGATGVVAIFTVLSKVLGFVRDMVIADRFGATGLTDAFTTVFFGLSAAVSVALGSALASGFLPVFAEARGRDSVARAWGIARLTIFVAGGGTALVSLGATILARPILGRWFALSGASLDTAVLMARIILPVTFLSSIYSICQVALNAYGRFGIPAMAASVMNVLTIGGALILGPRLGIVGLAWGTALGMVAQVLILVAPLRRVRGLGSARLLKAGRDVATVVDLQQVILLAVPPFLSQMVNQGYQLIDKGLAAHLGPGTVSALGYAGRVTQVPVGVIAISAATAVFPTLAALASKADFDGFAGSVTAALRAALTLLVPFSVGLIIFGRPLTQVLFERGAFTPQATAITSAALSVYALSVVGHSVTLILSPAYSARRDTLTAFKITALGAGTNILLDCLLVARFGYLGLAMATAIATNLQAAVLYTVLCRRVPALRRWHIGATMARMAVAALVMIPPALWAFAQLQAKWAAMGSIAQFTRLGAAAGLAAVVYFAVARLLGVGLMRPKRGLAA